MNCGIYKITNPLGKIYIGQSRNVIDRKKSYKKRNCKGQTKLYRSINKYGWDNHLFEVVLYCEKFQLNELEIYYINLYNSLNRFHGLNIREGGSSGCLSNQTKIKLSKAHKKNYQLGYSNPMTGKKRLDLAERNKMGKGKTYSDEYKKKMSESCKGRIVSEETKNRNRLARIGTKLNEETKLKIGMASKAFHERYKQERLTMIF